MKNTHRIQHTLVIVFLCVCVASPALSKSSTADEIEDVIKQFRTYDYADDPTPIYTIENIIRFVQDKPDLRAATERHMIALLESDATVRAKQYICHQLWIIATDASVPILEKMLLDQDTAEMACYALRTHPSDSASRVLREALKRVDNQTKIRIINILGDRKDTACVDQLINLLKSQNTDIAEAAAISLGTIGTDKGIDAIAKTRATATGKMRVVLTRAWLRGAEYYARHNRTGDAIAIYQTLFDASEPLFVRRSALVSALNTGHADTIQLLNASLDQDNPILHAAGIANSHLLEGPTVTRTLISAIETADSNTQVLLVEALGRRDDPLVKEAITKAATTQSFDVRIAAYNVLADIGDASFASVLCNALKQNPAEEEIDTMLACLRRMSADGVDRVIVEALDKADAPTQCLLIRVISDRRYRPAVSILSSYADDKNPDVAKAALRALGTLGHRQSIPNLMDVVLKTSDDTIAEESVRAIIAITRRDGLENYVRELTLGRLEKIDSAIERCRLMPVLVAAPGEETLNNLQGASKDRNTKVQDCAVRLLADYPQAAAASILLDIFKTTKNKAHRMLALRGCSRLCKTTDLPAENATNLCRQAMSEAASVSEEKLILSTLAEIAHPETLQMALEAMERSTIKTEASLAVIALAEKLAKTNPTTAFAGAEKVLGDATLSELHPRAKQVIATIKKAQ
ncbi:MAG: HEAT repeat domain-containing protein [Sedimentisphaerales bacterium]|nr:HEAT repeat domain-containing protein [Sedimentisphaerales bacterium]